jgi:hypothetical protein
VWVIHFIFDEVISYSLWKTRKAQPEVVQCLLQNHSFSEIQEDKYSIKSGLENPDHTIISLCSLTNSWNEIIFAVTDQPNCQALLESSNEFTAWFRTDDAPTRVILECDSTRNHEQDIQFVLKLRVISYLVSEDGIFSSYLAISINGPIYNFVPYWTHKRQIGHWCQTHSLSRIDHTWIGFCEMDCWFNITWNIW